MAIEDRGSKGGRASVESGHGAVSAAEVEKFIKGIDFPCDNDGLYEHAQEQGAPDEVLDLINDIPDGQFQSAADVAKGIGEAKRQEA